MKTYWYKLLLLLLFKTSFAANYHVQLGDETVVIQQIKHGRGKAFIHLHQNETTALKAAKKVVASEGGSVITLVHSGARNIVFHFKHKRYEFDPNRIFTDVGIKKTLTQFGAYSPKAHHMVKKLATKIKKLLPQGKVIAVHNNKSYSFKDYLPGNSLCSDAKAINYHKKLNHRNFYLVTQRHDYKRLKRLKFNSILQARHATDDGSLSVYLSHGHYVNVEAGYSQLAAQIKMLKHA